jgi:hypothetical protein
MLLKLPSEAIILENRFKGDKMGPNIVVGIAFIIAGAVIAFAGYQIRYKNRLNLIAGYDPNRVKDKEGLGSWVGNGLMGLGVVQAICGLLGVAGFANVAGIVFAIATVLTPIVLISRISRFTN